MELSGLLLPLLFVLLAVPLFLQARKQKRQMRNMQQLQNSLQPGDRVMTTSGLRATVVDSSSDDVIELEIADGVTTEWVRAAVREKVAEDVQDTSETEDSSAETEAADNSTNASGAEVAEPIEEQKKS